MLMEVPNTPEEELDSDEEEEMSSDEARLVKEDQDAFMRGELDPDVREYLEENHPNAIPNWQKMKTNAALKPEPELTLGENSEVTDKVLVQIAKDCIRHKWKQTGYTFNSAEIRRYRAIDAASTPSWGFWGGYSFLEEDLRDGDEPMGFIRVYRSSDGGSAKFSFWVKDGSLMLCHA
jgi:hypothetical protein